MLVLSLSLRLLGVEPYLSEQGLNLNALLVFAAVFGFGGAFVSLALSKWTAKRMTGALVISQAHTPTEAWLIETVRRQARAAAIGMPEVAVFDTPEFNAFATGMSRNNALVAVSSGLLASMTKHEAEAVLAHEVSHIANGDMVTLILIQGVVNTFVIFLSRVIGHLVDKFVFRNQRGQGPAYVVTYIVAEVMLGVLASMIVMWFSRRREYRADAGAASLAGHSKMIAALERLQAAFEPSSLPKQMAAFGITGGTRGELKRLFASHPGLDERIAALREERV